MNVSDLRDVLIQELGYAESPGFKAEYKGKSSSAIPDIDDVYFIQDIPIIYFCQFNKVDPQRIWELYRRVWSQSKVPLLYVILPEEIRIYNSYTEPSQFSEELDSEGRLLQNLQRLVDVEIARREIRSRLYGQYNRLYLETGAFWNTNDGLRVQKKNRADQRLLSSMDQIRLQLIQEGLSAHLAYALLGRSIFIRYLEDRSILTPSRLSLLAENSIANYRSALSDKNTTYRLFEKLSDRFHGDLFPIDKANNEYDIVQQKHLDLIGDFLDGYNFDTGQRSFWPYDFKYIPIELISGIYDTFLYSDKNTDDNEEITDDNEEITDNRNEREGKRRSLGAYYTPLSLVDFVIEETLPLERASSNMTILDPACGSGVFLVRVYQRLIEAWKLEHSISINARHLSDILKYNIFGVDVELNAVRIAIFSLYLAMLDYLDNEEIIKEDFYFPNLENTNLLHSDFFSLDVRAVFSGRKFDRIIGNPPWGRGTLTREVLKRIEEENYKVGGKQIVQIFLQYAPKFCADNGELALLAPAKGTILVASNTHEEFRKDFFQSYDVRAVVNFSALVYELFASSLSPVVALFYQPKLPSNSNKLVYGVPKPSTLSQHLGAIVLDATEIKYLDREELMEYPVIWKVASWGTARDAGLIERLKALPTLGMLEQANPPLLRTEIREGYIKERKGVKSYEADWLYGKPLLDVKDFEPYVVRAKGIVQERSFERPRNPLVYTGPLALIHRSKCEAAFVETDFIAYRNKITGVAGLLGQENLLKWLVAYINSPLARYYHFLTSSSWAVERGTIIHDEYKNMPFLVPHENDPRFKAVLNHFDQITDLIRMRNTSILHDTTSLIQDHEEAIANLIFDVYDLTEAERYLVGDIVNYEIEFFYWMKRKQRKVNDSKSKPVKRPDSNMLRAYAETFVETTNSLLRYQDQILNAVVFQDGLPLSAVGFKLVSSADVQDVQLVKSSVDLRRILHALDVLLLEQRASTLYMRRHVRVYDGPWLYFVRPSECRFWTRSQAYADADSFIVELLDSSRRELELIEQARPTSS